MSDTIDNAPIITGINKAVHVAAEPLGEHERVELDERGFDLFIVVRARGRAIVASDFVLEYEKPDGTTVYERLAMVPCEAP